MLRDVKSIWASLYIKMPYYFFIIIRKLLLYNYLLQIITLWLFITTENNNGWLLCPNRLLKLSRINEKIHIKSTIN